MPHDEYQFVAAVAGGGGARRSIILDIRPADEPCQRHFARVWERMYAALKGFHEVTDQMNRCPAWTTWNPSKWLTEKKPELADRQKYAAWDGDAMVGMLNLRPRFQSQYDADKQVLYVEHVAASPGNVPTTLWNRRLTRIGTALLAYSVYQSQQQGFGGLIGMHAADQDAFEKYRAMNARMAGRLFHPERTGVPAPYPVLDRNLSKVYLEMTPQGASELLEGYRNG